MTASLRTAALAVLLVAGPVAVAQDSPPPANSSNKPIDIFTRVRSLIGEGRFETAAEYLKDFQKVTPADQDYLDIESRFGATAFEMLKTVPRWYEDPKKNIEFVQKGGVLDSIVEASRKANEKLTRDRARVTRFVRNLGGFREEQLFAIAELRRSGDFAVPYLIDNLRTDATVEQRAGVYTAISSLGAEVVPGMLAAAEGLGDELKVGLLRAIARRPDALGLVNKTDTNFLPMLWYLASGPLGGTRDAASTMLAELVGPGYERRPADAELIRLAEPLYNRKGQFVAFDKVSNKVRYWQWDQTALAVKPIELPPAQAEERFGLKYLRWANERNPQSEAARSLFVALAVERAVERTNFGNVAQAEPAAYRLMAAAPTETLVGLLDQAITDNRVALALGLVQGLGDRADRTAAVAVKRPDGSVRPPVLAKALNVPDPRVQLGAAAALLRMPQPAAHGANARVVEVLGRAITGESITASASKGHAIVADPSTARGDEISNLLRGLGYYTDTVENGRDLFRLVRASSDVDLIVVDRHIVNPTLPDVLSVLRSDANAGRRPVLIVASADNPKPVGLEQLLLRLAMLVAATETSPLAPTPVPLMNREKLTQDEMDRQRAANAEIRDRQFAELFRLRQTRLQRLVRSADLEVNDLVRERLALRVPQLTYAGLIAEFEPTPASAPLLWRDYRQANRLLTAVPDPKEGTIPTNRLVKLIQQLEAALTPDLRTKFDTLRGRIKPAELQIVSPPVFDAAAADAAERAARPYRDRGVAVIPEPFASEALANDLKVVFQNPAQMPRDPAEKKASSKLAVEWLRRLAVGEVAGYDVRPAEPALRTAVANDELAPDAAIALARIAAPMAQTELIRVAGNASRPVQVRVAAADAAVLHIQSFGKLSDASVDPATGDNDATLRARLVVLRNLLAPGGEFTDRIRGYTPPTPAAAAPAPKPKEGEDAKPVEEKKDGNSI